MQQNEKLKMLEIDSLSYPWLNLSSLPGKPSLSREAGKKRRVLEEQDD
jgi:hypothetical protein